MGSPPSGVTACIGITDDAVFTAESVPVDATLARSEKSVDWQSVSPAWHRSSITFVVRMAVLTFALTASTSGIGEFLCHG